MSDFISALKAKQIDGLMNEYNQAEDLAFGKLKQIFNILKKGDGMRRIEFSNGEVLTNCWDKPQRLTGKLFLDRFSRNITEFVVSNPKSIE